MLEKYLIEAAENTDAQDPAQGLVRLNLSDGGRIFGHVLIVENGACSVSHVAFVTGPSHNLEMVTVDYPVIISLAHIVTARYADLREVPRK